MLVRNWAKRRAARTRSGWTLLEIAIATVVLLILVMGFAYGLASSTTLGVVTREQGLASEACRARVEALRATPFQEVLARYDPSPDDDPAEGASPGAAFDVAGLEPREDDADGHVGEIVFPLDEKGELREDLDLPRLGLPCDLSGEGEIDALDHSDDYRLLPVLVRVEWRGAGGDARFELATVLKRMQP